MLELRNISIKLSSFSLQNINLKAERGDYFVLLGRSGTGKSILLEMIAGIIKPDSGKIILDGKDITTLKIQKRKVGIVFQDYAVFPHLTVRQNIEYSLKGKPKQEREDLLNKYAELTNIKNLLDRHTQNLSGGELQRTALARTLVKEPDCLLLDEPLTSLDIQLKSDLRMLLKRIHRSGVTILHVTHDYTEAAVLSNKVAVLNDGEIIQQGKTQDVFKNPENKFVADFAGIKNYFRVKFNNNKAVINDSLELEISMPGNLKEGKIIINENKIKLFRKKPDHIKCNITEGKIIGIFNKINTQEIILSAGPELTAVINNENSTEYSENESIFIHIDPKDIRIIP